MRVDLRTQGETLGSVTVIDGAARASDAKSEAFLGTLVVVEPGSLERLTAASGERYLRALPANIRGSRLWAVLTDPSGS